MSQKTYPMLVYRLGSQEFAIRCSAVLTVLPLKRTNIIRIVDPPEHVQGVLLRDLKIIPIVSLHKPLGLKERHDVTNLKVILINIGKHIIGLLVDESNRAISSTIKVPDPEQTFKIDEKVIRHVAFESNRVIPILNIGKVINVAATVKAVKE